MAFERPPTLPKFSTEESFNEADELKIQSLEGLKIRLARKFELEETSIEKQKEIEKEYLARLDFELSVIIKMNFSGYFLIVSDFIRWAKHHQIPVGPGRGSGASSLVAFCLDITDVDPVEFDLVFERFLNGLQVRFLLLKFVSNFSLNFLVLDLLLKS